MQDFTYDGAELNYWLFIEIHTGIVIACLMTLKPLLGRLCPNLLSGDSRSSTESTGVTPDGPPLTIGSRPLRNGQIQRDSWMAYGVRRHQAQQPSHGDIILEDVREDNKAHGGASHHDHPSHNHQGNPYSMMRVTDTQADLKPPGSATSQFTDRTDEYHPTAKARSMA